MVMRDVNHQLFTDSSVLIELFCIGDLNAYIFDASGPLFLDFEVSIKGLRYFPLRIQSQIQSQKRQRVSRNRNPFSMVLYRAIISR